MTSHRTTGIFYNADRSDVDDAASIRSMIKAFQKMGVLPADWKFSVRKRSASMCTSIDVTAESPRPIYAADPRADGWVRHAETGEHVTAWADKYTRQARTVGLLLAAIHDGHNHDGSDYSTDYFDVKFYGHPVVTTVRGVPEYDPAPAPRLTIVA